MIIFPGRFNPFHYGHKLIIEKTQEYTQRAVIAELSINNVDKGDLSPQEIRDTCYDLAQNEVQFIVTNYPRFIDKVRNLGFTSFVIGSDTAIRLFHAKYYKNEIEMKQSFQYLKRMNVQFFVFGRKGFDFQPDYGKMELPVFRLMPFQSPDISSTELRAKC